LQTKEQRGLGILNVAKLASALRLWWLWYEWKEEKKPWVGLGNPCTSSDRELFEAATCVTIGNGKKALVWEATWLDGMRPKDVAPLISFSKEEHHGVQSFGRRFLGFQNKHSRRAKCRSHSTIL
jgi:hypothetical protein